MATQLPFPYPKALIFVSARAVCRVTAALTLAFKRSFLCAPAGHPHYEKVAIKRYSKFAHNNSSGGAPQKPNFTLFYHLPPVHAARNTNTFRKLDAIKQANAPWAWQRPTQYDSPHNDLFHKNCWFANILHRLSSTPSKQKTVRECFYTCLLKEPYKNKMAWYQVSKIVILPHPAQSKRLIVLRFHGLF